MSALGDFLRLQLALRRERIARLLPAAPGSRNGVEAERAQAELEHWQEAMRLYELENPAPAPEPAVPCGAARWARAAVEVCRAEIDHRGPHEWAREGEGS